MDLEAGLYRDDPEFDGLVDRLSSDLFQISSTNGKISELLRKTSKQRGLSTGSMSMLDLVQANQLHFRTVKPSIERLQVAADPNASQKYTQQKIVQDFTKLFMEFKKLQELVVQQSKEQSRHEHDLAGSLPADESLASRSVVELDSNISESAQDSMALDTDFGTEQELAFEQLVSQDEIRYQEGLVAEREQEIENIAQGMNELNEIYTNLGSMVREQGLTLDNIEANIYNTRDSARGGEHELARAARYQRRQTGRNLCFLTILLVLALVIVIAVRA